MRYFGFLFDFEYFTTKGDDSRSYSRLPPALMCVMKFVNSPSPSHSLLILAASLRLLLRDGSDSVVSGLERSCPMSKWAGGQVSSAEPAAAYQGPLTYDVTASHLGGWRGSQVKRERPI